MTPGLIIDAAVEQVLPFSKRILKWLVFVRSVCYPSKWLNNSVLEGYMKGVSITNWDATAGYAASDRVIYNYGVWEALDSNTGIAPDTDTAAWFKLNDSFIGVRESAHFGGSRLNLEYALNRYFQTTFRQPNDPVTPARSDIYIDNVTPSYLSFISSDSDDPDADPTTDDSYSAGATGYCFDTEIYSGAALYQFTVSVPTAVYTAINADVSIAAKIIRQFLDKYAVTGVTYKIAVY